MSGSREIFYFGKDFSGTDIYHSDIKNALLQIKIFFAYEKLFFKIRNIFYDEMLVRSKFSSQFVEKIEKFELSLSKQHNKC